MFQSFRWAAHLEASWITSIAGVIKWVLAPVDQAGLATSAEKVSIGTASGSLYDMAGTDPQTKAPARILASILPAEGTTWFFKMIGQRRGWSPSKSLRLRSCCNRSDSSLVQGRKRFQRGTLRWALLQQMPWRRPGTARCGC